MPRKKKHRKKRKGSRGKRRRRVKRKYPSPVLFLDGEIISPRIVGEYVEISL